MSAVTPASQRQVPTPHPRRWVGLAVLCASVLIVVMDMTVLNVALPAISADLLPTSIELLWMVDVYGLVVAGFLVTASGLSDRFGRRRLLLIGYGVFGAIPLLVLVIDNPAGLIALRALLGVGGALIMPSTMSMIRGLFTDAKERAVALAAWAAMASVGAGLGPIVGGVLLEFFDWHAAFLFNTPVMAIAAIAAILLLPESRGAAVPWDFLSMGLSIVGMASLMYAIKGMGKYGLTDPTTLAALVISAVALGWFVTRSLRRKAPLLDIRLLGRPQLSVGLIYALISSVGMAAMLLLLAQWMQLVKGYTPIETGFFLLPMAIMGGAVAPFTPKLAQWMGIRNLMVAGLLVGGVGFAILYLGGDPLSFGLVVVAEILLGLCAAVFGIGSVIIMSAVPPERTGNAAALEETSYELGNALGVAVLGSIAAAVFRSSLSAADLAEHGVTGDQAHIAQESLGGALAVAEKLPADTALIEQIQGAFTGSLGIVGLVGGGLMAVAAVVVWFLTPTDVSVEDVDH